jgi:chloramphenicol 3-O-phosphotransferase
MSPELRKALQDRQAGWAEMASRKTHEAEQLKAQATTCQAEADQCARMAAELEALLPSEVA